MGNRDLLRLALANLNRMRARVALTAIGVVIGTAAIIVIISLVASGQRTFTEQLASLGDLTEIQVFGGNPFGFADPTAREPEEELDAAMLDELLALPHVLAVSPQQDLNAPLELQYGRDTAGARIQGLEADAVPHLGWEMERGVARLGRGQIVIGQSVFEGGRGFAMAIGPGGAVPRRPSRNAVDELELQGRTVTASLWKYDEEGNEIRRNERFRVVGVFAEGGGSRDYSVFMSLDDVEALNEWYTGTRRDPRAGYDQVLVKVDERESVMDVVDAIESRGFTVFSSMQQVEAINIGFQFLQAVFGGIGAIALLVAAFGIANTMTMAIYERTKEIGIMKAIGATNRDVLRIFLAEAGAIGLLGGVGGTVIGWSLIRIIELWYRLQQQSQVRIPDDEPVARLLTTPLWLIAFSLAFATLVGLVSGVYPALRAASMKPLRALRTD